MNLTAKDVLELTRAGWTKEEIGKLIVTDEDAVAQVEEEGQEEPAQKDAPLKGQQSIFDNNLNALNAAFDSYIQKMQQTIEKANIDNLQQPAEKNAVDVMVEIVDPREEKGE